jgi:hypothetical protein
LRGRSNLNCESFMGYYSVNCSGFMTQTRGGQEELGDKSSKGGKECNMSLSSSFSLSITGLTAPGMVMLLLKSAKIRLKLKE